jgi:hypothetical protein
MSDTVLDLLSRADESFEKSEEVRRLLETRARPFQMFCRTVSGRTITINDMTPTTTVKVLMEKIQDKDGIPPSEQMLIFSGKVLDAGKQLALYGIGRESTVHCSMRLRGGYGEREAMEHVVSQKMSRGNVGPDVLKTEGRSYALKAFGRQLKDSRQLKATLRKKFTGTDQQWEDWWARNRLHVSATIQETTHSGNCGDFAQVVASTLVNQTDGQYVYQIVMTGDCKGPSGNPDCTFGEGHSFDHQLCVTYPIEDAKNGVTRSDSQMRGLKLSAMDPTVATVADGWHNHRILTLSKWMEADGNCYHKVGFANLKIVAIDKCGALKLSDTARKIIAEAVEEEIEAFEKTDKFAFDRFAAVWDAASRRDRAKGKEHVAKKYGIADGTPGKDYAALQASLEAVFNERFSSLRRGFQPFYDACGTASDKTAYIKDLDTKMKSWNWEDPKKANFLKKVKAQSGLDAAIHILMGADNWEEYLEDTSDSLPTFGMNPMGPMLDERSTADIDTQMVTIPVDNWTLFEREALALSDAQLLDYANLSGENCFRVMHLKSTKEKLFDHLKASNTPKTVKCFQTMDRHLLDYVVYADGVNVLGSASESRLHAMLIASSEEAQVKRIVTTVMDTAQAWKYIVKLDAGKAATVCGWLNDTQLIDGFMLSADNMAAIVGNSALSASLKAAISSVGAKACNQVFDCGDDKIIKAVMALFTASELESISEMSSPKVQANLVRLAGG